MSTYGWANITGVDNDSNSTPGGINGSVQYNDNGINFAGVSDFTYQDTTKTLNVVNVSATNLSASSTTPGVIKDKTLSTGTSNQILSSDGSASNNLVWRNEVTPAAPNNSIQFNNNGLFGGSANLVRNPANGDVNINANLGVGSLTAPTDRLVVTGANSTAKVKSTTTNSGFLILEDSSASVKQFIAGVATDTADFTSIQQGVGFKNFRFNPTSTFNTECISIATPTATAVGGVQCSNALSNRKIILFTGANNEHQNYSLGINASTFRFQLPDNLAATRYAWFAGTGTGTSTELMRLSGNGTLSIGNTNNTFPLEVTGTIRSTSVRPNTILDTGNAAGTAGQILSSTGTGIQWVNQAQGVLNAVQYNSGGGIVAGSANLQWIDAGNTLQVNGTALIDQLQANDMEILYKLAVGTLATPVPRIFAQSGTAVFAISSWDDQWIVAGGGTSTSTSAGIGMGYNTASNYGVLACTEPATGYKPLVYSAASHDFKTNGSTRMTVTQTPGGDGLLTTHTLQPTLIRDTLLNTGADQQVLTSTGTGLQWRNQFAPYCAILNGQAPSLGFAAGTGTPSSATPANAIFGAFPRTSSYRISTSVSGYSGGAGTVNNMQIWRRSASGNPWILVHTHQLYFNNALFHLAYPTKSSIISITAGVGLEILVRSLTPNTASDNNDFYNIELMECTV